MIISPLVYKMVDENYAAFMMSDYGAYTLVNKNTYKRKYIRGIWTREYKEKNVVVRLSRSNNFFSRIMTIKMEFANYTIFSASYVLGMCDGGLGKSNSKIKIYLHHDDIDAIEEEWTKMILSL